MLTQLEREFVEPLLVNYLSLQGSPRTVVVAVLPSRLRAMVPEGLPALNLVMRVIDLCTDDGYAETPPVMATLLNALIGAQDRVPEIVARLTRPPPAAGDPFDALVLISKIVFLDRRPLRNSIRLIAEDNPRKRAVIVTGNPKSGKSYTGEFIDHVCAHYRNLRLCRIDIDKGQGPSTGPSELTRDIVTQIGGDSRQTPRKNSNLERWTQDLANWVLVEANRAGGRWWFILDGFNGRDLRADTQMFIVKLSKQMANGIAARLHRLILIDFDRTILPLQPGLIALDTTGKIPHAEVQAAVRQIAAESRLPVDVGALATEASNRILGGFPDPIDDLPELGQRFDDLFATIEQLNSDFSSARGT